MRLHARLDLDSLPVAGPEERLPGDPVKPTATKHSRPDEAPKPWKRQRTLTVSCPVFDDGRNLSLGQEWDEGRF